MRLFQRESGEHQELEKLQTLQSHLSQLHLSPLDQNLSLTGCVDYGEIPNRTFYVGDKDITILDRIRRRWELIIDAFGRSPTEWTTEQFISVAFFIVFILIFVCLAVKLCSCCCEKKRGRPSGTAAATRRNREVIEQVSERVVNLVC